MVSGSLASKLSRRTYQWHCLGDRWKQRCKAVARRFVERQSEALSVCLSLLPRSRLSVPQSWFSGGLRFGVRTSLPFALLPSFPLHFFTFPFRAKRDQIFQGKGKFITAKLSLIPTLLWRKSAFESLQFRAFMSGSRTVRTVFVGSSRKLHIALQRHKGIKKKEKRFMI